MDVDTITFALEKALEQLGPTHLSTEAARRLLVDPRHAIQEPEALRTVSEALTGQPEFNTPRMVNCLNGRTGFQPDIVGRILLHEAKQRGSAESAVRWLEKVLRTETGAAILVQTLWGLSIDHQCELLDGLELVPFSALPASRQKEMLSVHEWIRRPQMAPWFSQDAPSAALVARHEVAPYLVDAKSQETVGAATELFTKFADVQLCLAMVGPAPLIPGPAWFQYIDPDLEAAIFGYSTLSSHPEVLPTHLPETEGFDCAQGRDLVGAFVKFDSGLKTRLRTAMGRLHLSLVRRSPADKSLELAIALETLLIDSAGEHTFKVALRAALMTADSLTERSRNRAIIQAAYGLRSALMHSGHAPATCKVHGFGQESTPNVVAEATRITAKVIRRVLMQGGLPDWPRLELSNTQ